MIKLMLNKNGIKNSNTNTSLAYFRIQKDIHDMKNVQLSTNNFNTQISSIIVNTDGTYAIKVHLSQLNNSDIIYQVKNNYH
jgi:hypothetical protein